MKKVHFILLVKSTVMYSVKAIFIASFIIFVNALYFTNQFGLNTQSAYNETQKIASAKLAIVIDDFGQDRNGVKEMMSIKRHLTFAVMPFLTFSQIDAQAAHEKGFEVIVHLPMEPVKGKISWLGPKPILSTSSDNDVYQITSDAIKDIPYAVGANIHMGSKASSNERIMTDVLDIIKENNIYFLDSKTSSKSVVKRIADIKDVPVYERDIFLDGQKSKEHVKKQLKKAGEIALKNGKAVAIGHVGLEGGKVTAQAIIEMLPEFDRKNIQLVFVSELEN